MKSSKTRFIAEGAMIAALYIILTYISMAFGLDKGIIQCRFSEALTVLPIFLNSAVPGLFIGCFLSNLLTGCAFLDVVVGSLTTLVAALITRLFKRLPFLASIPPILLNTLTIPFLLSLVYNAEEAISYLFVTVFLGEFISCGILGSLLIFIIRKRKR